MGASADVCKTCGEPFVGSQTIGFCGRCGEACHTHCIEMHLERRTAAPAPTPPPPHPPPPPARRDDASAGKRMARRWGRRKPSVAGPSNKQRVFARDYQPLQRFAERGAAPALVSWRVVGQLRSRRIPVESGRVEIWDEIVAVPPIDYVALAVAVSAGGEIEAIVSAEVAPALHNECFLGIFIDERHGNLGKWPGRFEFARFAAVAEELLEQVLVRERG